jgi:hypothetical protein
MTIRPRSTLLCLALLLLASACSSTERNDDGGPAAAAVAVDAGGDGATTVVTDPATGTPAPGAAAAAAGGDPAAAVAPVPGAPAANAASGGSGTAAGAPATPATAGGFANLPHGKGITDEVIRLGIVYADAAAYNTAAQALGGASNFGTVDDPKGIQSAIVDYFNANGGIAGRQIEPVWHEVLAQNAVTKEGRTRDAQEACATYTEDNEVFAIMGSGQWTEQNIIECAVNTDTPYIDGFTAATGVWASEAQAARFGPHYYTTSMFTTDRREKAMVQSLRNLGFFAPDAKVGLVIEDSAAFREAADNTLKPALEAAGVEVAVEVRYPDIIESAWQNYVLQMQAAQVTHVYFGASTAESWPTLLFMRGAENQGYRPSYALSGLPLDWLENNAPPQQLEKAMGFTWLPSRVEGAERPPSSERDRICREVLAAKDYPETAGLPFCDFFWFVKDTLERAPELTPLGMQTAAEQLGDGWMSTLTFNGKTRLGPGRHDGAHIGRDFRFDAATAEFVYAGPLYEVG